MQTCTEEAALLAGQQLLAEEEQAASKTAAKKAKKDRQKAKKRQQQLEQEQQQRQQQHLEQQQGQRQQQQQQHQRRQQSGPVASDACAAEPAQATRVGNLQPQHQLQQGETKQTLPGDVMLRQTSQAHAGAVPEMGPTAQSEQPSVEPVASAHSPPVLPPVMPACGHDAQPQSGSKQSDAAFLHNLVCCPLTKVCHHECLSKNTGKEHCTQRAVEHWATLRSEKF